MQFEIHKEYTHYFVLHNIILYNVIRNYNKRNRFAVTNCHRCRGVFLPIQKIDLLSIVWTLLILIFSFLELLQFKKDISSHVFEHELSLIEEHLMLRTLCRSVIHIILHVSYWDQIYAFWHFGYRRSPCHLELYHGLNCGWVGEGDFSMNRIC